jgi:oxygen-independent coproporphyrinogen III oxidase
MAGIYINVPFCKRICSYCDFYKSAVTSLIPDYLIAIEKELDQRKEYLQNEKIETLYLGGGTPSLLTPEQIGNILESVRKLYPVSPNCEITIEANPDDLSKQYLDHLVEDTPVNRISIGIQSFNDRDLLLLNRRHTVAQALECIELARNAGFKNISIDLIYGLPGMDCQGWKENLDLAFSIGIQHLSAYHLSIEPGTAFSRMMKKGLLPATDEEESSRQFALLNKTAEENGFIHYEISNLAKEGYFSRHNTGYWEQKKYLGIGPAAHSYDINSRQWNIPHVKNYIAAIAHGYEYAEREELDANKRYNEYLMVSLRTFHGADMEIIRRQFGEKAQHDFIKAIQSIKSSGHMIQREQFCKLTREGWLISDYIISKLMKD